MQGEGIVIFHCMWGWGIGEMNIEQLEYFVAVCEEGSMAAAARCIYIAQQSVSSSMAALEKELGVLLLERSSKGVRPTEAGRIVLKYAKSVLGDISAMRREVTRARSEDLGTLALAYVPDIFNNIDPSLRSVLVEMVDKNAGAPGLFLIPGSNDSCRQMVREGLVDCAIVTADSPPDDFGFERLARASVVLFVPRNHPLDTGDVICLPDLRGVGLLNATLRGFELRRFVSLCAGYGFIPSIDTLILPGYDFFAYATSTRAVCLGLDSNRLFGGCPEYATVRFAMEDRIAVSAYAIYQDRSPRDEECRLLAGRLKRLFEVEP